jgi:hypothetical protein
MWKILGTLGRYVDNESIPLKIIFISVFALSYGTSANLCFTLQRVDLLLTCIYFYARVNSIPSYFNLNYSLVGKHHVVGKDQSIYDHSNIFDHELLLLTIIYMISELGGETLSPYLSLCLMDAICSKNML